MRPCWLPEGLLPLGPPPTPLPIDPQERVCWICLENSGTLILPCKCPRWGGGGFVCYHLCAALRKEASSALAVHCPGWQQAGFDMPSRPSTITQQARRAPPPHRHAHSRCLARWQLQSAGSRRETHCDFCNSQLPDWKAVLTPLPDLSAPAVMNVNFDGRTYSFEVRAGMAGYSEFTESIRRAFNLPDDSDLNITFTCDEPTSGAWM